MTVIDIKPDAQGKVRDIYDLGDKLLMVTTDRISAFDYILDSEIPNKGRVLTQLSLFWLDQMKDVVDNHLISADVADLPEQFKPYADYLNGRFMLVKKAEMFPVECIVRGYLAGSGLKEYEANGTVCGIELPAGPIVREADGLAKSSRNTYLSAEERAAAPILFKAIQKGQKIIEPGMRAANLETAMKDVLASEPLANTEYVTAVDALTMQPVETIDRDVLVAMAVRIGTTRLIDNFSYHL